jgi:hypothetical protein
MANNHSLLFRTNNTNYRSFSKKQDKKDDDYSSAFDDLVNKGGVSKDEKAQFEQRKQEKADADKKAAEDTEKLRA